MVEVVAVSIETTKEQQDEPVEVKVSRLEAENRKLRNRLDELEDRIDEIAASPRPEEDGDDLLPIERYSEKPKDVREHEFNESVVRAVEIFENWWEVAGKTDKGWVASTKRNSVKKNNPSQFKLDVERVTDESLEWVQIYRAMQQLAKLSGGEVHKDDYDRLHIQYGAFEYHERPTPDGEQLYKMLVLADENSLTLL